MQGITVTSLERPLVLPPNLFLFLRREVILNVEGLTDLFRCLTLDHVSYSLASQIQQSFNVQIICCLNAPDKELAHHYMYSIP